MNRFPHNSISYMDDSISDPTGGAEDYPLFSESGPGSDSAVKYAIRNEEDATLSLHHFHPGSGAALILIAMVIISILCFSALSIVSARADVRLTDRYEQQTEAYQEASNRGQDFLAKTDTSLHTIYHETSSAGRSAYLRAAAALDSAVNPYDSTLSSYSFLQEVLQNTGRTPETLLFFTARMTDSESYCLVAEPLWPDDNNGAFYRVLSAKVVSTASYDYDAPLNVLR